MKAVSIIDGNKAPLAFPAVATRQGGVNEAWGEGDETGVTPTDGVFVSLSKQVPEGEELGGEEESGEVVWADAVIVTLPLSLLQQDAVKFDPPLPEVCFSPVGLNFWLDIIGNFQQWLFVRDQLFDTPVVGRTRCSSVPPPLLLCRKLRYC